MISMCFITVEKLKAQKVLKYLSKEMPLTVVPISEGEAANLESSVIDPEHFCYGKYRVKPRLSTLDMSHAKRIRKSVTDPESKLDILLTSAFHLENLTEEEMLTLTSNLGIHSQEEAKGKEEVKLETTKVSIPGHMIYIKEIHSKYKDTWPLTFST